MPFVDALAEGLRARAGDDPLALSAMTVLLPTRRAGRALREAFLRAGGGAPTLLPAMRPIGDVDADELAFDGEVAAGPGGEGAELEIEPAVPTLYRQLLLARLILRTGKDRDGDPAQAAELAAELARLLDQVQTEGLSFDGLADLVPETYAEHWRVTLEFLKVLTEHWPGVLAEHGFLDPGERRNRLIEALAARWRAQAPDGPTIAAGSTGSVPATAALLQVIAGLPEGEVVLPGLDRDMAEADWQALEPSHPQFGMKQLLGRLRVDRAEVAIWPASASGAKTTARAALVNDALRPAAAPARLRRKKSAEGLAGLTLIEAPGAQEESRVIALMLRRALETPGRTAALITPDRRLARRVAAELGRWSIAIDDSGGLPLSDTAPGNFLRLSAAAVAEGAAPVPLLALLKHPLAAGGLAPAEFHARARALERLVLRGPRPAPGFQGLVDALGQVKPEKVPPGLAPWLAGLAAAARPFAETLSRTKVAFGEIVRRHVAFAEWLAADTEGEGAARLWSGDVGEAAADFMAELADVAPVVDELAGAAYPALLEVLLRGRVVRPRYGGHPRLNIWGLLEARLQHADVLVLGGLNEGTWPAEAAIDPWLSRPMRASFGLPAPERRIGLTAHDFVQAACAAQVVLTRAHKVDGTPTVPSRWLLRLGNLLQARGLQWPRQDADALLGWQRLLDEPAQFQDIKPPEPRPPVAARPRQLSVTQIETWMRDPYAIYARHVLGLKALDPIDADAGAAERGIFIHEALDAFRRAHPGALPSDAYERLLDFGADAFGAALDRPAVRALWWPRFERVAHWFVQHEGARDPATTTLKTEVTARLELPGPAGPFRLTAKADRIDRLGDGGLVIIDYKTGEPPRTPLVESGYAPQLPLEAMLAGAGAFEGIDAAPVAELSYWRLSGGEPAGKVAPLKLDAAEAAEAARAGLLELIAAFDDPATPYRARPAPEYALGYNDYEHLARIKEWSAGEGEGG
jgi:ATP-dependent helicase/nuclease subunit B